MWQSLEIDVLGDGYPWRWILFRVLCALEQVQLLDCYCLGMKEYKHFSPGARHCGNVDNPVGLNRGNQ